MTLVRTSRLPLWMAATAPLLFALAPAASAENRFFPPAHEVFKPLRADPRELQYALRLMNPVSRKLLGEAAIGDYLGLWRLDAGDSQFQVNAGGGVFGRFDISGTANDMLTADFYGNLPFEWRHRRWSGRFMLYHTSSHLGDDYIKRSGLRVDKHSWDLLRWLFAYDASDRLRLYGGCTYAFRELPGGFGRTSVQGGFEWVSAPVAGGHLEYFWANDYQAWQRSKWNPSVTSQAGVRVYNSREQGRAIDLFLEFQTGSRSAGQFFREHETRWTSGVKFHLT